jgi:hypothetical protein
MTVLTFPTNPQSGQQYDAPNEIQYVFDGVKWTVLTVASTSAAVTDAVQDRVAPMFVEGTHDGITFTYNAATNVMSAEVTAVNGDRLINGANELILDADGTLIVNNNNLVPSITGPDGINISATDGKQLGLNWTPAAVDPYPGVPELSTATALVDLGYGGVIIEVNSDLGGSYWKFGPTGALVHSGGSATRTTSILLENNITTQVVWTGRSFTSGAKLTIQVECAETGGVNGTAWETQVCEAIVAVRGYNTAAVPVISVYGVTHTSAAPLMTFTVDRNPVSNLIEIVGTRTATASPLGQAPLTIYSVETRSND